MQFNKTNYNLPVNQGNKVLKTDKSVTIPEPAKTQENEAPKEEKSKVNFGLAKVYLAFDINEKTVKKENGNSLQNDGSDDKPEPLTSEELISLKDECGMFRFYDTEIKDLISESKKYPHIRDLIYMYKQNGEPRFSCNSILRLAAQYEDIDNRNAIKELAQIVTPDGESRFSTNDIMDIAQYGIYEAYGDKIKEVAEVMNDDNKPAFSVNDMGCLVIDRDYDINDLKEIALLKNNNGNPIRLRGEVLAEVSDCYKEHRDTIISLCSKKDFSRVLTRDFIEAYEKNQKFFDDVIDLKKSKTSQYYNSVSRQFENRTVEKEVYNERNIADMGTACNNSPEAFFELYDLKEQNKISEETFKNIITYTDKSSWKALKNQKFKEFFLKNADDIKSCNCNSSDNYVQLIMNDKIFHIKLESENDFKIVGKETCNYLDYIVDKNSMSISDDCIISDLTNTNGCNKNEKYFNNEDADTCGYIETIKNEQGQLVSRTLTKPSRKNPGVLVVLKEIYDENEKLVEVKELGTVDNYGENGERRRIEKEFTSPSGVTSNQLILEVPRGKRSRYESGGKIFECMFKIKDENTTETYVWGNKYEAKINDDNIEVTLSKKDGTTNTVKLDKKQIDFDLLPLIKKLPGDFLYTLGKTGTRVLKPKEWEKQIDGNACYINIDNSIYISDEYSDNPFVFAHEFGHMLDKSVLNNLYADTKLNEIFKKELDAYKDQASRANELCINYFVDKKENDGEGIREVIAETVAILSGLQHDSNHLVIRGKILQENFPETMAYIGSKLQNAME